jgi:tRNA pseudouridine55 synthase
MEQQRPKNNKRAIDGILLLDKPIGITSNKALQIVKYQFNACKAGHTGSLDPLASGMLPICLGQATKFSQYLLEADKRYHVICKFGVTTTTGDAEGEIIATKTIENITLSRINEVLLKFQGNIEQIPSMYSAIKYHGQPLYKLARQGITVERKSRPVTILQLKLIKQAQDTIELDIICSKGTYIRTLVEDIGQELGCGAHVVELRRLSAGSYGQECMVTLQMLGSLLASDDQKAIDKLLLPVASVFSDWQKAYLSEAAIYYLRQGQAIIYPYKLAMGKVSLLTKEGRFLGIGKILDDGKIAPDRLIA